VTLHRRRLIQMAAGVAALPTLPRFGWAQVYPSRPITLVVFVPAGGAPDISARIVADALSQRLGQSVLVENRPGAGGNLALQAVARSSTDGYTLLLIGAPHAVNVTLYGTSNLDVTRDIDPVSGLYTGTFVMVVSPSLSAKTLPEFLSYAKSSPGKINLTSTGAGNLSHLAGELFKMMTGIDVVHVPYKGAVQAHAGLLAGEVHVMFDAMTSILPQIQSGRLRALAVTTDARSKTLRDVPTVAEYVPGYRVSSWLGIGAPKGTPREIIDRLNAELNEVLTDRVIEERFAKLSSEALLGSASEFGKFIAAEAEKWGKVVRATNIAPN
jgi:tripartite-type tricarboxylate transporter receptor subunit TctC